MPQFLASRYSSVYGLLSLVFVLLLLHPEVLVSARLCEANVDGTAEANRWFSEDQSCRDEAMKELEFWKVLDTQSCTDSMIPQAVKKLVSLCESRHPSVCPKLQWDLFCSNLGWGTPQTTQGIFSAYKTLCSAVEKAQKWKEEEIKLTNEAEVEAQKFSYFLLLNGENLSPIPPDNQVLKNIDELQKTFKDIHGNRNIPFFKNAPEHFKQSLSSMAASLDNLTRPEEDRAASHNAEPTRVLLRGASGTMKSTVASVMSDLEAFPIGAIPGSSTTLWPTMYCHALDEKPSINVDSTLWTLIISCHDVLRQIRQDARRNRDTACATAADSADCHAYSNEVAKIENADKSKLIDTDPRNILGKDIHPKLEFLHGVGRLSVEMHTMNYGPKMPGCDANKFLEAIPAVPPITVRLPFALLKQRQAKFCIIDTAGTDEKLIGLFAPLLLQINKKMMASSQAVVTFLFGATAKERGDSYSSNPHQLRLVLNSLAVANTAARQAYEDRESRKAGFINDAKELVGDPEKDIYVALPWYARNALSYFKELHDQLKQYSPTSIVVDECLIDADSWIAEKVALRPTIRTPVESLSTYIKAEVNDGKNGYTPIFNASDGTLLLEGGITDIFLAPRDSLTGLAAGFRVVNSLLLKSSLLPFLRNVTVGAIQMSGMVNAKIREEKLSCLSMGAGEMMVKHLLPFVENTNTSTVHKIRKQKKACAMANANLQTLTQPQADTDRADCEAEFSKSVDAIVSRTNFVMNLTDKAIQEAVPKRPQSPDQAFSVFRGMLLSLHFDENLPRMFDSDVSKLASCVNKTFSKGRMLETYLQHCQLPFVAFDTSAFSVQLDPKCTSNGMTMAVVDSLTSQFCTGYWTKTCSFTPSDLVTSSVVAIQQFVRENCRPNLSQLTTIRTNYIHYLSQLSRDAHDRATKAQESLNTLRSWISASRPLIDELCQPSNTQYQCEGLNGLCGKRGEIRVAEEEDDLSNYHFEPLKPRIIIGYNGGGVRGLVSLVISKAIEAKMTCGKTPFEAATETYGVSTGAIIQTGFATGRTVDNMIESYDAEACQVFGEPTLLGLGGKNMYNPRGLKNVLTNSLRDDASSNIWHPKFQKIHTLAAVQDKEKKTRHIASFDTAFPQNITVLEALMAAAGSAPGYFPEYNLKGQTYFDAGLFLNDPTCRLPDVHPRDLVISIGTGENQGDKGHFGEWLGVLDIPTQQLYFKAVDTSQGDCRKSLKNRLGGRYVLLDPSLSTDMAMDNCKNIPKLKEFAEDWVKNHTKEIQRAADLLCDGVTPGQTGDSSWKNDEL